ncbi:MAG: anti-sigma regulatory factor [Planctomycetales bacterium 4484_123]|nr:MAG: anti-sigma regulatory factor [Planctomycetales bacterium 4484_123]
MRRVQIRQQADVVAARQAGREAAKELGFGLADQTRLATAISELARNVVQYAGAGQCTISDESDDQFIRIRVVVEDHGPGIPDVERALRDGFSTGNGLGAGLPGTKRLVHEFDIESKPGHTRVTVGMRKRRH